MIYLDSKGLRNTVVTQPQLTSTLWIQHNVFSQLIYDQLGAGGFELETMQVKKKKVCEDDASPLPL